MSDNERIQAINLRIDGVSLKVQVPASEEAYYRRAEKYFNERIELYRRKYRLNSVVEEDREKSRIFVAFEIALMWQKLLDEKDPSPVVDELQQLCKELHHYMGDLTQDS